MWRQGPPAQGVARFLGQGWGSAHTLEQGCESSETRELQKLSKNKEAQGRGAATAGLDLTGTGWARGGQHRPRP